MVLASTELASCMGATICACTSTRSDRVTLLGDKQMVLASTKLASCMGATICACTLTRSDRVILLGDEQMGARFDRARVVHGRDHLCLHINSWT
jgi:hypothetical protein